MIEAFRHDAGSVYHIVKRCLVECPAFVNGSAEHTRCCAKDACNDVISIGNSSRHVDAQSRRVVQRCHCLASERELTLCCRPSVCRLYVCLSSVCNARAPYSGGCSFRQYFYGVWYLGDPLRSMKNFYGDRPRGTPPSRELNKHER